jgi:hypothetical protein
MKFGGGGEKNMRCCTRKERSGLARLRTGSWRLNGAKVRMEVDVPPVQRIIKCRPRTVEMSRHKKIKFLSAEWLKINGEVAYKKMTR